MTAADFLAQMLALLPPGRAWLREAGSGMHSLLSAFAPELARVQARADQMLLELSPFTVDELIDEWEAAWGLPDECSPSTATSLADRRAALQAKINETIGHNPADYEAIATTYGHASASVTRRPYTPFVAGAGVAGAPLYGERWPFAYFVDYMDNDKPSPNDFSTDWSSGGTVTVTANAAVAPDGATTADRLQFVTVTTAYFYQITDAGNVGKLIQFDVWLRSVGTTPTALQLQMNGDAESASVDIVVDQFWRPYTMRCRTSGTYIDFGIYAANTADIYAWNARAGVVDEGFECRLDDIQQAHGLPIYRTIGDYVP